jgi:outer membrane protein OmpA-like peptidoglycan-associated protein
MGFGEPPTQLKLLCKTSIIFSNFIVGDYRLRPPHYEPLQQLAATLAPLGASKNFIVLVEGHTDSSGKDLMNQGLSQSRAHEVVNFLRQSNVKVRIIVIPRGEKLPRASNATEAGRAQNRRVEVRVCKLPPPPPIQA